MFCLQARRKFLPEDLLRQFVAAHNLGAKQRNSFQGHCQTILRFLLKLTCTKWGEKCCLTFQTSSSEILQSAPWASWQSSSAIDFQIWLVLSRENSERPFAAFTKATQVLASFEVGGETPWHLSWLLYMRLGVFSFGLVLLKQGNAAIFAPSLLCFQEFFAFGWLREMEHSALLRSSDFNFLPFAEKEEWQKFE